MIVTEEEFEEVYNGDQFPGDFSYVPDLRRQNIILRKLVLVMGLSEELLDQALQERLTICPAKDPTS